MEASATGLSLVLSRILLSWCEQVEPVGLERYLAVGGFQGLARARAMETPEVVAELRASGLRDRGGEAEPVYLKWQRFARGDAPGVLVVDASELDPAASGGARLLAANPYGLVEGLMIAAQANRVNRALVLLPAALGDLAGGVLNALEESRAAGHAPDEGLEVEFVKDAQPSFLAHDTPPPGVERALIGDLETWYHQTLVLSLGARWYGALGVGGQSGTRLIDLLGSVRRPGLVEVPLGTDLWRMVEALGGGPAPGITPLALAIDDGMGGFLTPMAAQIPLAPEELLGAGVNPGPATVRLLGQGACLVDLTRQVLYRYWRLSGDQPGRERNLITRALRMTTEVCRGKGREHHLDELLPVGRQMAALGIEAAWPLVSSLTYFRQQWLEHIHQEKCPAGVCLKRPLAPCHQTCPAAIDIPSFLALIGHGEYEEACRVIPRDNPFPYACGLVCPAPCETKCLRGGMDQPISIRAMKAVAARHTLAEKGAYPHPNLAPPTGKTSAVVGSGPAGLTAAFFLAQAGHKITVFEAQAEPGGMLRYGIPAYRLPRDVLAAEVAQITALGVEIVTDRNVENIPELKAQGFDAIFLAVGTQVSRLVPIEGVHQEFVLGGIDFLKRVRGGEDLRVGPRVVVIGGGNVAMDVALTAARQGGKRVDVVCLEKRREMPASGHEIEQALNEGVAINNSWGPLKIAPDKTVTFQRCDRVFDERGRFSPQFDAERLLNLETDSVILAIGQATDLACVEEGSNVEVNRGLICADPDSLMTRETGVFAGGDVVSGPRTVVEAVRMGKIAAASMDAYLTGGPSRLDGAAPVKRAEVLPLEVEPLPRNQLRRPEMPMREVEERAGTFQQIELGLTDQMAHDEAARCLRCDMCIGCGLCQYVCSEIGAEALRLADTPAGRLAFHDFTRPQTRCIGCGACGQVCPTGAIRVVDDGDIRRTIITGTVVKEHHLVSCESCGKPWAPQVYIDHLKSRVGPQEADHVQKGICPDCARSRRTRELTGWPFFDSSGA